MKNLPYPIRLGINAIKYLFKYGPLFFISKTKDVYKRKFKPLSYNIIDENERYRDWIKKYEPATRISKKQAQKEIEQFKNKPLVSFLIPVYNVPEDLLYKAIQSIRDQYYENWEICMVDDASPSPHVRPLLEKLSEDPKIKVDFSDTNNHISINTNKCFDLSSGEYVMLMDNDDEITPDTLYEMVKVINENPDAALIYFDEDKLDMDGQRTEPWLKPDFSPELMRSMMVPTHALYSLDIYERSGKLRKGYEGSQDYDLALRVMDLTEEIYHIPKVLYHWRKIPGSTAETTDSKPYVIDSAKKSLLESLERKGLSGEIIGNDYPFKCDIDIIDNPTVEIIIPTRDRVAYMKQVIKSILKKTAYENYTITVVDNGSIEPKTLKYFDKISQKENVKIIRDEMEFNFSALNNLAAKQSDADFLLFLNNDTKVITPKWIEEMLMWAQQDDIGAVGAKLLFPDQRVQHAGILLGMGLGLLEGYEDQVPVGNHAFYLEHVSSQRYFNHLSLVKNYSAVTGACLMVSREKFNEVGGFNEKELAVAFNDVDLCLKLNEKGYRTVYTPWASLFHFESVSREAQPAIDEAKYMNEKWGDVLKNDPYVNPNFDKKTMTSFMLPE